MKKQFRRKARCFIIMALFEWEMSGRDIHEIEADILRRANRNNTDMEYVHVMVDVVDKSLEIDNMIEFISQRYISAITKVELAILRLATYELLYRRVDIKYQFVINEAIELSKKFGSNNGYKYVNGISDKIYRYIKNAELNSIHDKH